VGSPDIEVWTWDAGLRQRFITGSMASDSTPYESLGWMMATKGKGPPAVPSETELMNREFDKLWDSLSEKGQEAWIVQRQKAILLRPGFHQPSPLDTGMSDNDELRELVKQYPAPVLPSGGGQ
jgi:hypothetical protein